MILTNRKFRYRSINSIINICGFYGENLGIKDHMIISYWLKFQGDEYGGYILSPLNEDKDEINKYILIAKTQIKNIVDKLYATRKI